MRTLLILLLISGLFGFCVAQNMSVTAETSTIKGTVMDVNGVVIPDTTVSLVDKSGRTFRSSTNEQGCFQIEVKPDVYQIEFSRDGFTTYMLEDYRIASKTLMALDVVLNAALIIDTVKVVTAKKEEKQMLVTGTVYDPSGAAIPGVNVTVEAESNTVFQTQTNADGHYEMRLLPGKYSVQFSSPGFKRTVLDNFRIVNAASGKIWHDVILEIGSVVNAPIVVSGPPRKPVS